MTECILRCLIKRSDDERELHGHKEITEKSPNETFVSGNWRRLSRNSLAIIKTYAIIIHTPNFVSD